MNAKVRKSNMELLRIIAMAMVVVVHSDYWAIGEPSFEFCKSDILKASLQYVIESFSIICVNCFIFISGWFSIKASKKGLVNLLFQIFFYNLLIYFAFVAFGVIQFDFKGFLSHSNIFSNWFLISFIALYLLSPILNAFIEYDSRDRIRFTVYIFLLLEVVFGWGKDYLHFHSGYSVLHLMVIYLVARYIRTSQGKWFTLDKKWDAVIYLVISITTASFVIVCFYVSPLVWSHCGRLFLYNSPLVLISSVYFCLFFTKLEFKSKVVNIIGASSFAVFLIHFDKLISYGYMKTFCRNLFINNDILYFLGVMAVAIVCLFCFTVLIDQVRKALWAHFQQWF